MKGVVFTLFRDVVTDEHGIDIWDQAVEEVGVDGVYTSLGNYDHEEFFALAEEIGSLTDQAVPRLVQSFGRQAIPRFYDAYPELFESYSDTREFLFHLNDVIHPEVRKLYPGAEVPYFEVLEQHDQHLTLAYRSTRGLCWLGEGLIMGTAAHYGEVVDVSQSACVHRGDDHCVYRCDFATAGSGDG